MKEFLLYNKLAFLPLKVIEVVQNNLLRAHLKYAAAKSPYYKEIFKEKNINPAKIKLADLAQLPFTTKNEISTRTKDFYAVKDSDVADIVLSSGTTGLPTKIIYTAKDLRRLKYNEYKSFISCGMTKEDTVLLTCTMDRCFIAGLAYYFGVQAVGAAAIRNGLSSLESHAEMIKRMTPTVIIGVPSFLKKLGLYCREQKINTNIINKLICIGEPLRNERMDMLPIGRDLVSVWPLAKLYSTYSSSETISTFCECTQKRGGHLHPDLAIVEIVDNMGNVLPSGAQGEVVITPLAIEGMPLVRFRTGDISFIIEGDCGCGRKSLRLGPILGRKQQMMKIKGTTVYPQAVYTALDEVYGVNDYYLEAFSEQDLSDMLIVHVSIKNNTLTAEGIASALQAKLRVKPEVVIEEDKIIRDKVYCPSSRKPVHFFDERKP